MSLTSLSERSFEARMNFAYLVDALLSFNATTIQPSTTLNRLATNIASDFSGDSIKHPYSIMWEWIENEYKKFWFNGVLASELSESEFLKAVKASYLKGAEHGKFTTTGPEVLAKAKAWGERGWFRYEEKRQQKVDKAKKFGWITGLVLSSFII